MKHRRIFLAAAIAAGIAFQASASDIANVRIINDDSEQAVEVDLDTLAVGESRQLASSSGAPALVTRTEDGLRIEVAGKTTEVKLGTPDVAHWVSDAGDGEHVRVIKFDHDETIHESGDDPHKQVVVIRKSGEAAGADLSEAEIVEIVGDMEETMDLDAGDGERVIVTRRVEHDLHEHD